MRHIFLLRLLFCVVATAFGMCSLAGDITTSKTGRSFKMTSAIPDWNGVWVAADSFMDKQDGTTVAAPGRFDPIQVQARSANPPALKGEYLKQAIEMQNAQRDGRPIDDRGALCLPQGMPAFWGGPYAFEIVQTPSQINIYQEWNEQTLRVYLDGRPHPAAGDPSYNGHSTGTWNNGELTIDTVAIRNETLLRMPLGGGLGGHHSTDLHITQRLSSEGKDLLRIVETSEDDKALETPWVVTIHLRRKKGMEVAEYVCEENNRNPVDDSGVTRAVLQNH